MGRVDIVMNNAGVAVMGPPETISMQDWDWILQVNLFGVIRGRARVPAAHDGAGQRSHREHVVARGALRVQLGHDPVHHRQVRGRRVHRGARAVPASPTASACHSLCPGLVDTNSARRHVSPASTTSRTWMKGFPLDEPVDGPEAVATLVCDAIAEDRFLVLTDPDADEGAGRRRAPPTTTPSSTT